RACAADRGRTRGRTGFWSDAGRVCGLERAINKDRPDGAELEGELMYDPEYSTIEGPGRIRLGWRAKEQAAEYGWTDEQMAKHLLEQHQLRLQGFIQKAGEN